jgi:hypothetical protein
MNANAFETQDMTLQLPISPKPSVPLRQNFPPLLCGSKHECQDSRAHSTVPFPEICPAPFPETATNQQTPFLTFIHATLLAFLDPAILMNNTPPGLRIRKRYHLLPVAETKPNKKT